MKERIKELLLALGGDLVRVECGSGELDSMFLVFKMSERLYSIDTKFHPTRLVFSLVNLKSNELFMMVPFYAEEEYLKALEKDVAEISPEL